MGALFAILILLQTAPDVPPIEFETYGNDQPWQIVPSGTVWHNGSERYVLIGCARRWVAAMPQWLAPSLADTLGRLDTSLQIRMCRTLDEAEALDPRIVDEVAFCMAHMPLENLTDDAFDPHILVENAMAVYAHGELARSFARLVEVEDATDGPYTTVEVHLSDGWWRAPRWAYYWGVVHPRLGDDAPLYTDPHTGSPLPREQGGVLWRTYFMEAGSQDSTLPSPYEPFVLRYPNPIDAGTLGALEADGGITIVAGDPIVDLQGEDGAPVLVHFAYHQRGGSVSTSGRVTATTLMLEGAEQDGGLLENLLLEGTVYGSTLARDATVLVLRDATGMGTRVEEILTGHGIGVVVMDSTALLDTVDSTFLEGIEKIVVAGWQPVSLYEALVQKAEILEQWVSRHAGAHFLFLGEGRVWMGLPLPFGIEAAGGNSVQGVVAHGYTTLADSVFLDSDAVVWDGTAHPSLDGDRALDPSMTVLDRVGWFVSQMLESRVGEIIDAVDRGEYVGPDGNCSGPGCILRTAYSVRIGYQHYGNCGELQDMVTTTGRTALLPVFAVSGPPEDHVWNEFFLHDTYVSFQVDWSDGPTRIAVPGNSQDKDYGGGKDLSMVTLDRPDGLQIPVIDRYSNTVTLRFEVRLADGRPVAGAPILLASETWSDPNALTLAALVHTGADGVVEVPFGDHQNAYAKVWGPPDATAVGAWPDPDHVQWVLCADATATAPGGAACPSSAPWDADTPMPVGDRIGEKYTIALTLDGSAPSPSSITVGDATVLLDCAAEEAPMVLAWRLGSDGYRALRLDGLYGGITDGWEEESPTVYVVDDENLQRILAGEDATALMELEPDGTVHFIPFDPAETTLHLVVDNRSDVGMTRYVPVAYAVMPYTDDLKEWCEEHEEINVTAGGGCSCRTAGKKSNDFNGLAIMVLVLALAMALQRRR